MRRCDDASFLCIVHPIHPFTSFSRKMSSGISSKNTRLSRRLMVCYRLRDHRVNTEVIAITSHGTKHSAGVQRVYSRSSIQEHAEVRRSSYEVTSADDTEGAIMFNDSLSIEQCERLMAQLAETAFPFQCAHGRSVPELDVNFG